METLPLHPKLVHLPIALSILMPLLTSGILLAWWRGWLPKRTWLLSAAAQALLLGSALVAMRTGEADEGRVEGIVPEDAIESHERAAETFVWATGLVLVLTLVPLALKNPRGARTAALLAVAGTAVVLGLGYRVGESGGALVYRHGGAAAFMPMPGPRPPAARLGERETDDHH